MAETSVAGGTTSQPEAEPARRFLWFGLVAAVIVIAFDQATKYWIVAHVMVPPRPIEVTSFFNLVMAWNPGVSFSLLQIDSAWMPWILSAVALAIVTVLAFWLRKADRRLPALAIGLVIGGALGNVIDRVQYGAVADFLDFHWGGFHWPAFNVADSAISIGVVMLIGDALFGSRESSK